MKNGKKTIIALLGFLAAAAAGPAAAQEKGPYLGASFGVAQYINSCDRLIVACDDRDKAWRLFAGYQFNRWVGLEAAYMNLGKVRFQGAVGGQAFDQDSRATGFDLVGVLSIPVVDHLSVFGKLGGYRARIVSDITLGGVQDHVGETGSGFTYGLGVEFDLWKLGVRAEAQRYENVGGPRAGEDNIILYSLGLLLRF
jgi:OmpA-OmpF porin, OOP family